MEKNLILAELTNKITRKAKDGGTFYVLEISSYRTLTEMMLELRQEVNQVFINGKEVLFVFANRGRGNKYAYTLKKNCLYAFWFTKVHNSEMKENYFHVLEWKKLGYDKESISRTLHLALSGKENKQFGSNEPPKKKSN